MPYDGSQWDETNPTNSTLANEIDDVARDMKIGIRSRMAQEHIWPSAQTGTGEGGYHTYISFVAQTGNPTVPVVSAVTQAGVLFVTAGNLTFRNSAGVNATIISSGSTGLNLGGGSYSATGTLGDVIIGTGTGSIRSLAASAAGLALITNSNTALPNWQAVLLLGTANTVSGLTTFATNINMGGHIITGGLLGVAASTTHSMSNGETFTVPAGSYVIGVKRGGAGEIDQIIYSSL